VVGAGAGGYLVQLLTAPVVLLLDALSYLWSALLLRSTRAEEQAPVPTERRRLGREIGEGLRFVFGHPILRAVGAHAAVATLFQSANDAIMIVFLVREVHLDAAAIGLLGMVSLFGAIASSMVTVRLADRLGPARALWIAALAGGAGFVLFALTGPGWALTWYVVAGIVTSFCIVTLHVLRVSCLQRTCPDRLYGRANATMQFLIWGAMPLGGVLGGAVATLAGFRAALWLNGVAIALSALILLASPLRRMRELPS
jgi:MFS family permease